VREASESHVERWKRLYHLKGRGWAREQFVALVGAGVLLLLLVGLRKIFQSMSFQVGRSEWWTKLPPRVRYLVEGTLLEVVGGMFLAVRLKRRGGFRVSSFWDARLFLWEAGVIFAGLVFLVKASGFM
jgi:hypothetical protein